MEGTTLVGEHVARGSQWLGNSRDTCTCSYTGSRRVGVKEFASRLSGSSSRCGALCLPQRSHGIALVKSEWQSAYRGCRLTHTTDT